MLDFLEQTFRKRARPTFPNYSASRAACACSRAGRSRDFARESCERGRAICQRIAEIEEPRAHEQTERGLHLIVPRTREMNLAPERSERVLERGVAIFFLARDRELLVA